MAFNLAGFGAGFAGKLSERLDEDRVRAEKLIDENRQIATRQRLAKQAQRDQEKKIAKEMIGTLKMLGYSDENAAQIAANGKGAGQIAIDAATKGLSKGVDANTIFNFGSVSGDMGTSDQDVLNSTIDAAGPTQIGSLEATSEAASTKTDDSVLSREFGINMDVWKNLYAEPDKVETSYSARLAVISQKLARPTKDTNVESLKSEQAALLADLATMKEAEREKEGASTPSFTLGTISANVSEIRRGALTKYGFKLGIDDTIENLDDGNQHLADVASIQIAYELSQRNLGIQDPNMANTAAAIRTTAISGLKSHASAATPLAQTADEFATATAEGKYKAGQVVQITTETGVPRMVVYTGIPDYKTGMPFIEVSGG